MRLAARAAVVLLLAACAQAAPPPPAHPPATAGDLMEADRAFARATAERGLDGWMAFYAPDAVRLRMGAETAVGLEAVRAFDAPMFADSTHHLIWEPTAGGLFADSLSGWTTGRAAYIRLGAVPHDTAWQGAYVTIWRRQGDGSWKVVLDTGS